MSIVERQHYVWRKYLEAWAVDDKVWCRRNDGHLFNTNPVNLAVQRFFYALTDLTAEDVDFIRKFAIEPSNNEKLKKLNEGWISKFDIIFKLLDLARNGKYVTPDLLQRIAVELTQIEEISQGNAEQAGLGYLHALIRGDSSFYDEPKHASKFCFFLMQQYFRTKRMQETIMKKLPLGLNHEVMKRSWPVLRYIFATNTAFAIFARRKTMKLTVLNAPEGSEFITCDQPVINTYGGGKAAKIVHNDEFYYPVSPQRAMILSEHSTYADLHGTTISNLRAAYLNDLMGKSAYEQAFASKKESLAVATPK